MSRRTRRHPPHPQIVAVRRPLRAPLPAPVSRERTKDSSEPLNGPFLLQAPQDSFDTVWKALPGIFLPVFVQILTAGVGLKHQIGPQKGPLGVRRAAHRTALGDSLRLFLSLQLLVPYFPFEL